MAFRVKQIGRNDQVTSRLPYEGRQRGHRCLRREMLALFDRLETSSHQIEGRDASGLSEGLSQRKFKRIFFFICLFMMFEPHIAKKNSLFMLHC